jgi:tetratricopeptide (TPR) repeat protein
MRQMDWTDEEIYLLAERAYALYKQGQYREALIIFDGLVSLDPLNSYSRTALAAISMALGDSQRAVKELSFLLDRDPSDHDARARRCEAYCDLRNWNEARADLIILRRTYAQHHVQRLSWRLRAAGVPA